MCGLAGAAGGTAAQVRQAVAAIAHRGPDAQAVADLGEGVVLGHARLAIIDTGERSNQPFVHRDVVLAFVGEIWNYRALREELKALGHEFATEGDTEVAAAALAEWDEDALPRMEGMFAFAWWREGEPGTVRLARDRFGEVPLHLARTRTGWAFASELKAMALLGGARGEAWVGPGETLRVRADGIERRRWYAAPALPERWELDGAAARLAELLALGTGERAMSDVPVCTLLSGGIDSAAVALHLAGHVPGLTAYCASMGESKDVACAREAAEMIGIELRVVEIPEPSPADLVEVIRLIEMPHKAQVEIGWACLALARRMQEDGFKVTFSGEGSDELWASYGFTHHALAAGADWHRYRAELFTGQHRKNFARCNKVFMAHGVECRLPFLHTPLVEHALALPREAVQDGKSRPKAVIQRAYEGRLPASITRRPKLAFQDGLGKGQNLKQMIAERIADPKRVYAHEFGRMYG